MATNLSDALCKLKTSDGLTIGQLKEQIANSTSVPVDKQLVYLKGMHFVKRRLLFFRAWT